MVTLWWTTRQVIKNSFKENLHIIELGCMVHARRKFFDLHHDTQSPIAKTALDFFACLYQIEGQAKEASVHERTAIRQKHSVPVLEAMKKWLDEQALVVRSAKLLNAISYTLKHWPSLTRYAQDGSLPIDNNPVENHIRPIAIGKKELAVCGLPKSGPKYGGHSQFIDDSQTQRTRALCMVKKHTRTLAHAKSPDKSRTTAV